MIRKCFTVCKNAQHWSTVVLPCDRLHSQHIDPPGRPDNYCQLVSLCLLRLRCTRPLVDVADGIDGNDGDGWHSTGAYCTAKLTFSHGSPVIVWGAYCTSVRIDAVLYSRFYGSPYYNHMSNFYS